MGPSVISLRKDEDRQLRTCSLMALSVTFSPKHPGALSRSGWGKKPALLPGALWGEAVAAASSPVPTVALGALSQQRRLSQH